MNKKYLILTLLLGFLFADPPIWEDILPQSIDEDCEQGCTDGEFLFDLTDSVLKKIETYTKKIALSLNTIGLINVQFAIKDEKVYVIEANPRASRTVPFIAKAYDEPYVKYAAKVMMGENKITDSNFNPTKDGYAIKVPVFSFDKFPDVNKELGPEMKSTGEAIYFIDDLKDDYFKKVYSERNLYLSK